MGWLSGYTTRKKITIDQTKVDSALVNFPVFVKLRSTNFDFTLTTDTGNDIRFTAANGVSLLAFERDRHDKINQLAEYQVNIPNVSNSAPTEFYIYFKNDPSIIDGSNPTGVWDTSFQGRWSLDQDPADIAPQMRDSTVNANHGTTHGAMTSAQSVEGKIGRALDFDGSNDRVRIPNSPSVNVTGEITVEKWIRLDPAFAAGGIIVHKNRQYTFSVRGTDRRVSWSDSSIWNFGIFGYYDIGLQLNAWHRVVITKSGSTVRIYRDGVERVVRTDFGGALTSTPNDVFIGDDSFGNYWWFDGSIDEVRISNIVRSAAWIKASYNSSKNTLVTISATESFALNLSVSATPQVTVLAIRSVGISKFRSVAVTPQALIDRKPFSKQLFRSVSAIPQATVLVIRSVEGILKFRSVSATPQVLIDHKPRIRWLSGYTTRKKITIDQTKVDSALVNFPVFVKLRSTNFDFTLTTDTGNDIRFTAANGVSLLAFERDRHDKINQLAEYQVNIPNVSNSAPTEFYIYFKNDPSIIDGSNPTGVWDTSFQGRWSLDQDPADIAPQMRDSTVNANHGTTHGAMTSAQSVEGKIGRALDFDGSNDRVRIPNSPSVNVTGEITVEKWIRLDPAFAAGGIIVHKNRQYTFSVRGTDRRVSWSDSSIWNFGIFGYYDIGLQLNAWHRVVITKSGSTVRIYRDGVERVVRTDFGGALTSTPNDVFIGDDSFGNYWWFDGSIDEVRISNIVRSAAWIKASYNSSKNTLVTISATESFALNLSVSATPQVTVLAIRSVEGILKFRSVAVIPQVLIDRKPCTRQMFRSVSAIPQALIERKPLPRQMFQSVSATPRANIIYVLDDTMAALMKLPTRKSGAKLSIWFDGQGQPATVFTDDHIKSIRLLHELNDGIVIGELSISLLNQNFKLTPSNPDSPFFNRFKPGLKIKAELGIHGPARIEWTQLGTYYLDSWNAPATTNTLSLVAYDQLFRLLESKVLLGKQPAKANTTAQVMLSEALTAVGITNPDLTAMQPSIPIDIGWFTEDSPVQQVSLLLASGDFITFVDRATDRVRVIPAGFSIQKRIYRFDSSTVFEAHNPQDYVGARSIVEYSFSRPAVKPFEEVWRGAELQQGTHVGLELTAPVAMLEFSHQKGVADWTIDAGVTHFDITVKSLIPALKLFGYPIKDYPELVVATNPFAVQQYGKRVLRKVNRFVQNRTLATQLAEKQLARVSDHTNSFRFVASGQPALSFHHLVRLKIPEHRVDVDTLVLTKTETVYDGGLRLRAEGRRLV